METFSAIYNYLDSECKKGETYFDVRIWDRYTLSNEEVGKWPRKHMKVRCRIVYKNKTVFFDLYTHVYPEDIELLYLMVLDAVSVYKHDKFEDFCLNFSYSDDCIKALKIYESCREMKDKLLDLLGEKLFTRFMECEMDL